MTFKGNLEKDFEYFVRNIVKLQPAEFCGLAKVLSVPTMRGLQEIGLTVEELKGKTKEEAQEIVAQLTIPMDEVLEKMMDRFLGLPRRRRKEINKILKDAQRGK